MTPSVFISYRRTDSEGEAGRLADVLSQRFGEQSIFMDVDSIEPGRDFRKALDESVEQCSVVLAVLGPDWLNSKDFKGDRRIDEAGDYVRLEIAAALRRDIAVIPVLVRGGKVPRADELPADIADLSYRNGVELTHARWKSDLQLLIHALEPYMGDAASSAAPAPAADSLATAEIPEARLNRVAKYLATYVGPVSAVLVRRAAKRHTTISALCAAVAEEIESPVDRERFLAAVQDDRALQG